MGWEAPMISWLRLLDTRLQLNQIDQARAQIERMIEDLSSSPYEIPNAEDHV